MNALNILKNPYIMATLKVGLILYASQIAPQLPSFAQDSLKNIFVKIILISLLAYISELDFQLAILLAIVLVLGSNLLQGKGIFESYSNTQAVYHTDMTKYTDLLDKPAQIGTAKLIESQSDNYPGCNDVTIDDLISLFEGDAVQLQKTVQYAFYDLHDSLSDDGKENLLKMARVAGLPYNVELTDDNAPFIATLLLNYGYQISDKCQAPQ